MRRIDGLALRRRQFGANRWDGLQTLHRGGGGTIDNRGMAARLPGLRHPAIIQTGISFPVCHFRANPRGHQRGQMAGSAARVLGIRKIDLLLLFADRKTTLIQAAGGTGTEFAAGRSAVPLFRYVMSVRGHEIFSRGCVRPSSFYYRLFSQPAASATGMKE